MSNKISFEGIGGEIATFWAEAGVQSGQVVKLTADSTVAPCAVGDRFCGVAVSVREDVAGVRMGGFVQLGCADGGVTPGYVKLCADGNGGVKKATSGEEYLVVADDGDGHITVWM